MMGVRTYYYICKCGQTYEIHDRYGNNPPLSLVCSNYRCDGRAALQYGPKHIEANEALVRNAEKRYHTDAEFHNVVNLAVLMAVPHEKRQDEVIYDYMCSVAATAIEIYERKEDNQKDRSEEAVELLRRAVKMFRTTYGSKGAFAYRAKEWTEDAERFLAHLSGSPEEAPDGGN